MVWYDKEKKWHRIYDKLVQQGLLLAWNEGATLDLQYESSNEVNPRKPNHQHFQLGFIIGYVYYLT